MEFRDISCVSEAITAKQMKTDPYCQRQNCSPRNILFSDVQIALISQGVPQLGASNNGEMAKTSLHTHTAVARLPGVSWAFLLFILRKSVNYSALLFF